MSEPVRVHHGLTELLVDAGVVTPEQVEAGLQRQRQSGLRIGETLVEIGAATEEDIGWALARQLGMPLVDLSSDMLDSELIDRFSAGVLSRLQAVPLLRSEEGMSFALSDPTDRQTLAHLELLAECPILPSVATPSAIRRVLASRPGAHGISVACRHEAEAPSGFVVWDRSGANFLHYQLHAAQQAFASVIHFLPDVSGVRVYQRGPAGTTLVTRESRETFEGLLTQLELLGAPVGDMTHAQHREARVEFPLPTGAMVVDVALLKVHERTAVTLRLPTAAGTPETLESLGLEPVDLACVREVVRRPAGVVVVSGPAGSGGTTTLACLVAEALDEARIALVFADAPLPGLDHERVLTLPAAAARMDWESIVTAHEPDIVVFDDLPSHTCLATLAAGAGMGRLVIARIHWGDTFALLEHAATQAQWRSTLASRLHLVLQQRLLHHAGEHAAPRARFEVLVVSDAMRDAIRSHATARELRQLAEAGGFRSLSDLLNADLRNGTLDPVAVARALTA